MMNERNALDYEELYDDMLNYTEQLRERNRWRIRVGGLLLILLPVFLGIARVLTHSDKIVFLLLWVLGMFLICGYLIGVEYLDDSLLKKRAAVLQLEEDLAVPLLDAKDPTEQAIERRLDREVQRDLRREERRRARMERLEEIKNSRKKEVEEE